MKAVYGLLLRMQFSKGRLIALGAFGLIGIGLGASIGAADIPNTADAAFGFIQGFGVSLLAPLTALIFASAALGDPIEDGTLVYVWLRPVRRWRITLASLASTLTIVVPLVVIPMTISAALTGAGSSLVGATALAMAAAVVGYCSLFTLLGVLLKRALPWGLIYIVVFESIVSNIGVGTARLSVAKYVQSVLVDVANRTPPKHSVSATVAFFVIAGIVAGTFALTTLRVQHADVA